ncbi:hypothetical protein SAMN05444287_2259 [Octadecabacter temperatus]|uniref:Ankyrin repeat protein n=1 Tax=Octadecabacter temperatus TaxID=1458307 RepID=A0A0K0Y1R8_9RHOB|nr:ankyrin repeat domain-containing protein [Octadecabacter temperatus]AKS44826.1 Ankyrin repeat protein [Octadecabacter temperatus]SIO34832.1 hypothetical protein SAMN05444287_2259 [Octadecabacter temperatus]
MIWLLDNGADPNLPLHYTSNLMTATSALHPQAVALLIEAGADVDAEIGGMQDTALRTAIYKSQTGQQDQRVQIVAILLENGANPNQLPDDERARTLIEQVKLDIEVGIDGSLNQELHADVRDSYRRSVAANRVILDLLQPYGGIE